MFRLVVALGITLAVTGSAAPATVTGNPEFAWLNAFGVTSTDSMSVAADSNGNIVTAGYFYWTEDLDPGPGTNTVTGGGMNAFVTKVDAAGNYLWARSWFADPTNYWHDFAVSVATDSSDNIILMGTYEGIVDFDPGAGSTLRVSATDGPCFVVKLDSSGNFVWVQTLNEILPPSDLSYPHSVRTDQSDSVYACWGSVYKFSSNGALDWMRTPSGTPGWEIRSVAVDGAGNVHTAGQFSGTLDLDPGPGTATVTSAGDTDIFLLELDVNGDYVWSSRIGGAEEDGAVSIAMDNAGQLYVTGYFSGTADLAPGAAVALQNGVPGSNPFVLKLDTAHNYIWAHSFGDPSFAGEFYDSRGSDVAVAADGMVYVTGSFVGTVDLAPGPTVATHSGTIYENVFLLKLTESGDYVWSGGTQGGRGQGICLANDDSVVIAVHHPGISVDYGFGGASQVLPPMGVPTSVTLKLSQPQIEVPLRFWSVLTCLAALTVLGMGALRRRNIHSGI